MEANGQQQRPRPSTACSASQAQFAGHRGAWDGADAKLMEGLRDCVRRLLVAIDGTGPWHGQPRGGGALRTGTCPYKPFMLAVPQLRQQCVLPGSTARSHCGSMHRWSRLELARSGGTGYSMQTIGQGRR